MSDATKYISKLSGARVLIIGGSSGIGYCVAEACLEHGATVIISSSQPSRVKDAIERLLKTYPSAESRLSGHPCNLSLPTTEESIKDLFSHTGTVDHIVFTAGDRLAQIKIEDMTLENIQGAGVVRFFAPLLVAKHGSKHLTPGPGSSITLTSGSVSQKPIPGWTIPACYASGQHGMIRALALDLAPIRVNLIVPGIVETELWNNFPKDVVDRILEATKPKLLTQEIPQPESVAESYIYVLKDRSCTGSVISTNAGALMT